jgi:protein phosphatase
MISLEEARLSDNRNLVTRALGVEPEVEVDIGVHDVREGDILLLCSDGLNDMLDDDLIAEVIAVHGANLVFAAEQLVERANDYGGRDNVSVILVRVTGSGAEHGGWWNRLLAKLK